MMVVVCQAPCQMYVPTSHLQEDRRRKPKVSFTCTFPGINGHNRNTQLFPFAGPALACGSSETAPGSRPRHILGKGEYHEIQANIWAYYFHNDPIPSPAQPYFSRIPPWKP